MQKRFLFVNQALIFSQFREKEFKKLKFETTEKKKFKTRFFVLMEHFSTNF